MNVDRCMYLYVYMHVWEWVRNCGVLPSKIPRSREVGLFLVSLRDWSYIRVNTYSFKDIHKYIYRYVFPYIHKYMNI
jgi:hypothetical protein